MADLDDGLEGVLGSETPEGEGAAPVAGADAVAIAVALQKAGNDPALSRAASAYLAEQRHLVQIQIKHFDEERRLGIAAAKRRRYADHMRNGFYTCIALIALGVLLAAIRMTVQAMTDHSLVVEDFTVPADFAARGVTGQAVAEDLVSRVGAIRAVTNRMNNVSPAGDVRADQTGTLKVQIPETGISLNELERFLHRWLGHQTVVNGELREDADGQISILLHIAGADPIMVSGPGSDFDHLMQTTAERAFAVYSSFNYMTYLLATGHHSEAMDRFTGMVHSPEFIASPEQVRADVYALWGGLDVDLRHGLSIALIGADIDSRDIVPWQYAQGISTALGHDAAAVEFAHKELATKRGDQLGAFRRAYPWLIAEARLAVDEAMGDFAALDGDYRAEYRERPPDLYVRYSNSAEIAAALHEEALAQDDLARAVTIGPVDIGVLTARWSVTSAAADWPQALSAAKALVADVTQLAATNPVEAARSQSKQTLYDPWLAYAEAMTGDTASATALISETPTDCYLCVRTRAKVAAAAGDAATADHWFAEAVRQAPDLPMAYFEWGQALLARGDLAGAAREFSLAHEKGPHFADPLKVWGDVLGKQGHWRDALAKYDEALHYAPNWDALKQARDAAASKQG